jgi:hypothetical protein
MEWERVAPLICFSWYVSGLAAQKVFDTGAY